MLAALVVALAAAACGPLPGSTPAADPLALRASQGDGVLVLDWKLTAGGNAHGYELQTTAEGGWATFLVTHDTTTVYSDVEPLETYSFRIREVAAPGEPAEAWGKPIIARYYEPVLPVIRIDTENAAPIADKDNYVRAAMTLDPNGSDLTAYEGTLGIKGRGNSTWTKPKKPYRLKLDTKSPLAGIASNKDWVLLANFNDRSQLRTYAAAQIAHATDLDWTPTYRHVEVILNGRYDGVYQLTEAVKPGKDRVDITEMEPEDNEGEAVTGGYLMEIDIRLEQNNEPGWRTNRNVPVVVKEPDPMTPEQRAYISDHVQRFETSLMASNFTDPALGYRRYLDVESFADHYLVQELTRNPDAFYASTYFTKERGDEQLRFGPIWDFDFSMGSEFAMYPNLAPEGWHVRNTGVWVPRIFADPTFVDLVEQRWQELSPELQGLPEELRALGEQLAPAVENDTKRWGTLGEVNNSPDFVADWLSTRIAWFDDQLGTEAP